MSEFELTVFGSKDCSPCQSLKDDLEGLNKFVDMNVNYFEVDEEAKILEKMSHSDRETFLELVKEHGTGVPLIHVKTACGETSGQGYGDNIGKIIRMLESIKCEER